MIIQLLNQIEKNLSTVENASSLEEIERAIKSINEAACCYVDRFPRNQKSENYDLFAASVMPSAEETLARVETEEMGKTPILSTKPGIGKSDTVPADVALPTAFISGKSAFGAIDFSLRVKLEHQKLKTAEEKIAAIQLELKKDPNNEELKKQLTAAEQTYNTQLKTVKEKKLSLEESKPTSIERISNSSSPPSPLIAGVSTSAARTLVALYDLGFFGKETQFDFDKEQIMANCLMGFFIYGSHHSMIEALEPHNRLLDAVAITVTEKSKVPDERFLTQYEQHKTAVLDLSKEDYLRAFHPQYREALADYLNHSHQKKGPSHSKH